VSSQAYAIQCVVCYAMYLFQINGYAGDLPVPDVLEFGEHLEEDHHIPAYHEEDLV